MTSAVPIGLVVLVAILLMPVYVTLGAWLGSQPRDFRTTGVGLAYMGVIAVLMIASTGAMGAAFWIISGF